MEIVEEKAPAKKSKKGKKPAQQKPEDVDLDTLFKEMGVERRVGSERLMDSERDGRH